MSHAYEVFRFRLEFLNRNENTRDHDVANFFHCYSDTSVEISLGQREFNRAI